METVWSGAPFFGGEEPGHRPVELQWRGRRLRNTGLTWERNTHRWKWFRRGTTRGRQAVVGSRTVTGANELDDVSGSGRVARAKTKRTTRQGTAGEDKSNDDAATGQATAARLCSCECEG
ncbi:hypothetical protein PIB30_070215 [Stylosanthes scabra]|uniref:Uncharacterized protein n=1 Tax=Stylosanthes scabra TaxID=79078 RepID=A0ABU6RNK5_9FABA|nr:hypothetical protein [Stylosanthes scabra]